MWHNNLDFHLEDFRNQQGPKIEINKKAEPLILIGNPAFYN
jgi:hypothetical protein